MTPRLHHIASLAVFLLTFVLYLPTLSNGFVWDDLQITADQYIHDSSHWSDVLTYRTLSRDVLDNNRPAMLLSLMIDAALWLKNPFGYHLTSNLLHAANAALLCLLACKVLSFRAAPAGAPPRWVADVSAAGAMLFAVHPLVIEAVSVISFREDIQATFFVLMSLWLALRLDRAQGTLTRIGIIAGVWLLVLLALGSKETGIAAPILLATFVLFVRPKNASGTNQHAWWTLVAGACVVSAIFLTARFLLPPSPSDVFIYTPQRPVDSLAKLIPYQARIFAFDIKNILNPAGLSSCYTPNSYAGISAAVGVMTSLIALGLLVFLATRNRLSLLGCLLVLMGLAVVANIIPIYNPVADRYLYLPLAGGAWLTAGTFFGLGNTKLRRGLLAGTVTVLFLVLAAQNQIRQRVFSDDRSLWTDAAKKTSDGIQPYNFLGWSAYAHSDYSDALKNFSTALKNADNGEPDSWCGVSLCLLIQGRLDDACTAYQNAVTLQPRFRDPRLIQKVYLWRQEYLDQLAFIGRRTGLWMEPDPTAPVKP